MTLKVSKLRMKVKSCECSCAFTVIGQICKKSILEKAIFLKQRTKGLDLNRMHDMKLMKYFMKEEYCNVIPDKFQKS